MSWNISLSILLFAPSISQDDLSPKLFLASGAEFEEECQIERASDADEAGVAVAYRSPGLAAALSSWSSFWIFLHDPATPYIGRMAAAYQGAALVPPEQLQTVAERVAGPGTPSVNISPCVRTWNPSSANPIPPRPDLPAYPFTAEARATAPVEWQIERAVDVLEKEVQAHYAHPDRRFLFIRAMERWNTLDHYQAFYRLNALTTGSRDLTWMRRTVKLALENEYQPSLAANRLGAEHGDTDHFRELLDVARLVVLAHTREQSTAVEIASLNGRLRYDRNEPFSTPATNALLVARHLLYEEFHPHGRYYILGYADAFEEFPFEFDGLMDVNDPRKPEVLAGFAQWFAHSRERFERQAAAERPHLQQLLDELNGDAHQWSLP